MRGELPYIKNKDRTIFGLNPEGDAKGRNQKDATTLRS